jgi:hypothetical protein
MTSSGKSDVLHSGITKPTPDELVRRKRYIESLEVAEPHLLGVGLRDLATHSESNQAFVNDGSIQAFVAGMSAGLRSDVLMSCLLAQLAATKRFDRFSQPDEWYKLYKEVLENVGWVIQSYDFTRFESSGGDYSVSADVIRALLAICTGNEAALVQAAIDNLKKLSDSDERVVLFERRSHSDHQGNFQICAAAESGGLAVMKFAGFKFDSEQRATRVLFFRFSSAKASFFKGAQTVVLNNEVYSYVRNSVIQKLGANAQQYVKDIEI